MKRVISILLSLGMVASMLCLAKPVAVYAASSAELNEIQSRKNELQNQIDAVKADKNEALEQKRLMDQRNELLMQEIEMVNAQISQTSERITQSEEEEKAQYELFCRQVRQEEERGTLSYWSVLFKATSFADLLSRADFINEVAEHDRNVIDTLKTLRKQLAEDKTSLEEDKEELDAAQAELQEQLDAADEVLAKYAATEEGLQAMYDAEDAAYERVQAEIRAQSNRWSSSSDSGSGSGSSSNYSSGSGDYIWPTNNTRLITSPFGYRESPGGIGSTNHKGVDIGASYGTDVLAAKSGTVIVSDFDDGGYGNYVIIQHGGSGNYTLYGHMSTRYVSEGESVSQGQVIGLCGSTGASTGPHIHFEIHEDGSLCNPLNYLDGYVAYW